MNRRIIFPVFIILVLAIIFLPLKLLYLGNPDGKDLQRFPYRVIHPGKHSFHFSRSSKDFGDILKVNNWTTDIPFFVTLAELMPTHEVRSFVVIQRDTILYEYYEEGLSSEDIHASFSIAKSFTATLIGMAIDEGKIKSEKELVSTFIPEIKGEPYARSLTIEHLLNHTSGIRYSLFQDARIYYGKDILGTLKKIRFEEAPGTRQHYLNMNVQLLGLILYRATGKHPAKYLEEKIWQPVGMSSEAIWTVDEKNKLEKTFCCLGATALDYAKFGRLYLHKGKWEGKQIFSEDWYHKSISRDTSNGSSFNYNYCWHIGLKAYGDFMANGLYKQHIYINPEKELIIVSLNDKENKLLAERVNWWDIFRQIADQL